jgi:hypothetical protein
MAKLRKLFNSPEILPDKTGFVGATKWDLSVPQNTIIKVGNHFDFSPWYHQGIDEIVSACQQQIAHWANTCDGGYSIRTLRSCCYNGVKHFLNFLILLTSVLKRDLFLADINRDVIEQFIQYLAQQDLEMTSQEFIYTSMKMVVKGLCKRGFINRSNCFPKNPYPSINRNKRSNKALSNGERNQLAQALRKELSALTNPNETELTSYQLACCLLAIALRTGRNTTPLVKMKIDCLQDHPLKENRKLMVVFKRRAGKTHIVSMRATQEIETMTTIMPDVISIIETVIAKTAAYRLNLAPPEKDRLWLYKQEKGKIAFLTEDMVYLFAKKLVGTHNLHDTDGNPLKVTISRLRATFINRLWVLSGNDPVITAKLGGHTLKVSNDHYLQATPDMQRNHKFMGDVLVQELLEGSFGKASDNTPVGKCRDPLYGDKAPKNGEHCTNFLSCFRCQSCVITGDDLYRLFSFYWLIVKERNAIGARNWGKVYAHIIRIIDRQIALQFPADKVETARNQAKADPHPFWRNCELLEAPK